MNVILASGSPRRKELLKLIFNDFQVVPTNSDENFSDKIDVLKVPEILAERKVKSIEKSYPDSLIIGCDTCVILNNRIFGKPLNYGEAKSMLSELSGKVHEVVTGCCIYFNDTKYTFSVNTKVEFYPLSLSEIDDYINTGEPFDKAGGYGIQGYGSLFVKNIIGDYFNVIGLPVARLKREIDKIID